MTDAMYDRLKDVLADNERLFEKLHKVAEEYDAIEFDESGFYDEEVERCQRHWNTLAGKVAAALDQVLEEAEVRLLKNRESNICTLRFDITASQSEEERSTTRITVDYATKGQISVSREG